MHELVEPLIIFAVMLAQRGERVCAVSRRQGGGIRLREGHELVEDARDACGRQFVSWHGGQNGPAGRALAWAKTRCEEEGDCD